MHKVSTLIKKIRNFPSFIYQVHHYLKISVPFWIARIIQEKNTRDLLGEEEIVLLTYDGSNQACHPDIVHTMGKIWLAFTPYPYGKDEYENPCVYFGSNLSDILNNCHAPIDEIKYRQFGYHLSDPCIVDNQKSAICFYRESKRKAPGMEVNTLYYKILDVETGTWGDAVKINSDSNHQYLSPAIICQDKELLCYYAEWHTNGSGLYLGRIENNLLKDETIVDIDGVPDGFGIWHMTIQYAESMSKNAIGKEKLIGLFLLRCYDDLDKFKLVVAYSQGKGKKWFTDDEVIIPEKIKKIMKHPYKSCFYMNSNQILLSFVDHKDRYRLALIDRCFG